MLQEAWEPLAELEPQEGLEPQAEQDKQVALEQQAGMALMENKADLELLVAQGQLVGLSLLLSSHWQPTQI